MAEAPPSKLLGVLLRVGAFAFLEIAGLWLFGQLFFPVAGYFATAALSTFAAAAVANTLAIRIYERRTLADIGLGCGSALFVVGIPLLAGGAELYRVPDQPLRWGSLLFVTIVLLFGAMGEEMLFRGYGFQVLVERLGPFATILPVGVIFGLAHAGNQNFSRLGLVNTILWGILFGVAFLRSHDLWLPIGLHFAWNWTLPLFGANLSGFSMTVTGIGLRYSSPELISGGGYGPEASILTSLSLVGLSYFLWKAPIRRQKAVLLPSLEED
jgi:membrane protease YdiL (CAAX protease family)